MMIVEVVVVVVVMVISQTTFSCDVRFARVVLQDPATNCHIARSSAVVPSCGQTFDENNGAGDNKQQQIIIQGPA